MVRVSPVASWSARRRRDNVTRRRAGKIIIGMVLAMPMMMLLALLLSAKPTLYGDHGFSAAVYDRDGNLLRLTLAADQRYRLYTPLAQIHPAAIEATLLYEDQWFWRHPGVNPLALVRAAYSTFVARQRVMGASTISMQLARLRFDINSTTASGKIAQIARAVQLEWHYSKHEILEAYLNLAPYGGNVEGIGTASLIYFSRPARQLSLPEALTLAVIPQNPARRVPGAGGDELQAARLRLLARWTQQHPEDQRWQDQAAQIWPVSGRQALPFRAPHFVDQVLKQYGAGSWTTTLDGSLQTQLEQHLQRYLRDRADDGIDNAAALIVDLRDVSVAAWVGSGNWFSNDIQGQVDGVSARRSPGSTLKPFVYALAIDQGVLHPQTLLKDLPTRFGAYTPENFDRGFLGPVSAQDALVYSRNVPAVTVAGMLSQPDFHDFLQLAGVQGLREKDFYGLAIALGGVELSMLELAGLYSALGNAGVQYPLALLAGQAQPRPGQRLFSAEAAFITQQMLTATPPAGARQRDAHALAWKTGTSWAFRDAWAVGLFSHYLIAVWVGNFDGSGNPAFVGRDAAGPLLFRLSGHLAHELDDLTLQGSSPDGLNLRRLPVCKASGDLPGQHCPQLIDTWFIPGVSPIRVDQVHREVLIDPRTGLRSCDPHASGLRREIIEFWPSDLQALFRLAGLPRREPPPYPADCQLSQLDHSGQPPQIRSPSAQLEYALHPDRVGAQPVPLQAVTDAGARRLYWFEDDRYLGSSTATETLLWMPTPGRYLIRAVDDLGRSDAVQVSVRLLSAPASH
jgi:penicillin-binding protein 1C